MAAVAAAACAVGDTPCWCKDIGGEWVPNKEPLIPACRIYYTHAGKSFTIVPARGALGQRISGARGVVAPACNRCAAPALKQPPPTGVTAHHNNAPPDCKPSINPP